MAIATVVQGTIEVGGKVVEFDSFKASVWLESVTSFRFEPTGASKPYTVRKESRKAGDYWYGYRKVAGKLHKKYIGRTPELNIAKLEEIGETLNIPPQPRATDKVTHQVNNLVAHETVSASADRLTALELQMKAVQESLEALRSALPGKPEGLGEDKTESPLEQELEAWKSTAFKQTEQIDSLTEQNKKLKKNFLEAEHDTARAVQRFVKAETEVSQLHNELGNLKQEMAKQKDDYAAQLAISQQFYREVQEVRSQLETVQAENEVLQATRQNAIKLPEAPHLLNKLKGKRKKVTASLADVEAILEIMKEF